MTESHPGRAPEVADALAAGGAGGRTGVDDPRARSAARGEPADRRPRSRRRCGRPARCRRPSRCWTARSGSGSPRGELDRLCASRRSIAQAVACGTSGPALALGVDGATTVASTAALAHRAGIAVFATGGLGGVHRGAAETFDVSADLGVLATHAGARGVRGREVDPRRPGDPGVPGDPVGAGDRLPHRLRSPGFYLADSGYPVPWRVDTAGRGRRGPAGPARSRHRCGRAWSWRNPCPRTGSSIRSCTTGRWRRGLALLDREGVTRQGRHPAAAGVLPRPHARGEPAGQRRAGAGQRGARRRGGRRPWPRRDVGCDGDVRPHVVVVGDVGLDVVGALAGPIVPGRRPGAGWPSRRAVRAATRRPGSRGRGVDVRWSPGRRRRGRPDVRLPCSRRPACAAGSRWTRCCRPAASWCWWSRAASARWCPTGARTRRSAVR